MGSGIYVALSGAVAQADALDVTANNVAHAGIPGYRADRVTFGQALSRAQGRESTFVSVASTTPDPTTGAIQNTNNPLDLALEGDGYFAINTSQGVRYTRHGEFRLDGSGHIVDGEGNQLRKKGGGALLVPPGTAAVHVDETGTVQADDKVIGTIEVQRFAPTDLKREDGARFIATGAPIQGPGQGAGATRITAGALESANFNVVRGVVDLVRISRTYEALHQMISSYKEMDERSARAANGMG